MQSLQKAIALPQTAIASDHAMTPSKCPAPLLRSIAPPDIFSSGPFPHTIQGRAVPQDNHWLTRQPSRLRALARFVGTALV